MTLLAILAAAVVLSVVLTLALLVRGARRVEGRSVAALRWHESGEAVEAEGT